MPRVSPEHGDARQRQILGAALACFSRQGFHKTTMKDIVRESGLSAGAIYNYFSSKGEIVDAIARERHASERALLEAALAASDKPLELRELARAFFSSLAVDEQRAGRRVGIEVWAEALRNPEVLATVRRGVDEPRRILATLVEEAQARDELPPDLDPEGMARVMVALFQGLVLQQAWDPDTDVERYLAAVERILSALSAYGSD